MAEEDWDIEAPDRDGRQRRAAGAQAILARIRALNGEIERHLSGDEVVFDGHPTILLMAEILALMGRYQPALLRTLLDTVQDATQTRRMGVQLSLRVDDLEAKVIADRAAASSRDQRLDALESDVAALQAAVDGLLNPLP